jgi:Flp pilus assembly protein TadD
LSEFPARALSSAALCLAAICLVAACGRHQTHSAAIVHSPIVVPSSIDQQILNAVNAGDGDLEIHQLRARLDSNPADLSVRLELARRYQKLGFPEVAIEHCRLACERAPDSDEAHLALAKALRDVNRSAEAASVLDAYAAGKESAGVRVWAWLGLLRDDTGNWKAGETAHRRALALAPERDDLHNNLGYCLLRQGRAAEAATEFRTALKLQPHSQVAENNLAMALAGEEAGTAGNKEAIARLESVSDPASAHNNMAVALIEAGRYAEARQEIDAALRYNRTHSAALNNLRLISELDGRPAELNVPVRSEGRWSHVQSAWRRLRGSAAPEKKTTIESGSSVASR